MKQSKITILLYLLPILLIYFFFLYGPLLITFILSFSKYNLIKDIEINGLNNYFNFFKSGDFNLVAGNTLILSMLLLLLHSLIGLGLALAVNSLRASQQSIFRIIIFFPCILTTASVAIAWQYIGDYNMGILNWFLKSLGLAPVKWFQSIKGAYSFISIFSLWKFVGTSFLYFFIGLSTIPKTYYEVARIEGSGRIRTFLHVTFPALTPTTFFVIMNLLIGVVQIFDEPYFLTNGGPFGSTKTINLFMYRVAYQQFKFGYASSIAVVLFIIIMAMALFQVKLSRRWVNYDSE